MTRQVGPPRDLGPGCVNWDPAGDNLRFDPTFGTITFRSEDSVENILHDEHGVVPVDAVFTGRTAVLEVPMTSPNLLDLEKVIHDSEAKKSAAKYKILWVPNVVGDRLFPIAKEMVIKPVIDQVCSANTAEWLHILRCYPVSQLELGYDNSGQRIYNVMFACFPDDASGQEGKIWRFGPAS